MNQNNTDVSCRDFHSLNGTDICHFMRTTDDCQVDEGLINYSVFVYCSFSSRLVPLGITILVLWWFILFILLAVAADDFFCPSLVVIAKTLRLSDNIAGVTLLAFGNGAPDVFSAIAAVKNEKNGDDGLAFGALLGAGIFVTTVVVGAITVIRPFHLMERPFLRDVIFYIAAVFMTFVYLYRGSIRTIEAAGFIIMYVIYVIVVVVGRTVYQRQKRKARASLEAAASIQAPEEEDDDPEDTTVTGPPHHVEDTDEHMPLLGDNVRQVEQRSYFKEFLTAINPVDTEEWPEKNILQKIYVIAKAVPCLLLTLTIPVVDYDKKDNNWNKPLGLLHCLTAPVFSAFAASATGTLNRLGGVFPVWALMILIGVTFFIIVFFTSKFEEPPVYHWVFAYVGFTVAVIWIQAVANEIVNILQTFGIILNISNAVLGLTLLAWGNSLGDLVADTVMARQGYPRTGVSACYGGPLFNLLLGVGIPFTIRGFNSPSGVIKINISLIQVVLVGFLLGSLILAMVTMVITKFQMKRPFGIVLFVFYGAFLVIAILVETNVIASSF